MDRPGPAGPCPPPRGRPHGQARAAQVKEAATAKRPRREMHSPPMPASHIYRAHARRRPGRRPPSEWGGPAAGRSRVGRPRESWRRESDGGERRRGRRPARGCQAQTHVLAEQCSRREQDAFHGPYLSAKIPEAAFHGQAVKTVASLRVSTAPQDVRSQRLAILEYARHHDVRIDAFIEATASGQASDKRRRPRRADAPPPARRPVGRQRTLPARSVAGADRRHPRRPRHGRRRLALKEHIRVEGTRDIQTKVMTTLFALFAEVARDLHLRAHPRGPRPGPGPRANSSGARRARSASHASTARRTTSGVSSSWASPRPPSPRSPACPVPPSTAS